jgi:hypothetical protein
LALLLETWDLYCFSDQGKGDLVGNGPSRVTN